MHGSILCSLCKSLCLEVKFAGFTLAKKSGDNSICRLTTVSLNANVGSNVIATFEPSMHVATIVALQMEESQSSLQSDYCQSVLFILDYTLCSGS